jgi:hypothetical protein
MATVKKRKQSGGDSRSEGLKKSRPKAESKKSFAKGIDQLAAEVMDVAEEIESVSQEGSALEDIEGAKALTAGVLEKYSGLMKRLDRKNRLKLQQSIGPGVERIRTGLRLLKEAPEG